jgi:DNA sulfur modification protein DndB
MTTYYYLIARTHYQAGKKTVSAGQVLGRHNDNMAALSKRYAEERKCNDRGLRHPVSVVMSETSFKVGEVSEALLAEAVTQHRQSTLTEAMVEVLRHENGETLQSPLGHVAVTLMDFKMSMDELRAEFTDLAKAEIARRKERHQSIAEHNARQAATKAEVKANLNEITYSFPAVRGIQAGREYYVAQVPYAIVAKLFVFDDEAVPPECRAQRVLNERRAEAIGEYIADNATQYVLPALTVSVSAEMSFESVAGTQVGTLNIPMDATILINDGQHRRRGIELALKKNPGLSKETIAVSIYFDQGLKHSQQMFADINSKQVKPSSAINALYDQRSKFNVWVIDVLSKMPDVNRRIDYENNTVGAKSTKLWSLVNMKKFFTLFTGISDTNIEAAPQERLDQLSLAVVAYFAGLRMHVPDWASMLDGKIAPSDVREQMVIGHTVWLHALGVVGSQLVRNMSGKDIGVDAYFAKSKPMSRMSIFDPAKGSLMWKDRCVVLGKMQMTADGVKSTASKMMQVMGLTLTRELTEVERKLGA